MRQRAGHQTGKCESKEVLAYFAVIEFTLWPGLMLSWKWRNRCILVEQNVKRDTPK
jgi:hypothetical protein